MVQKEKEALLVRKQVPDAIFQDARMQFDGVRKREADLRALLGEEACRLAEDDAGVYETP